jgi:hypothetical protein
MPSHTSHNLMPANKWVQQKYTSRSILNNASVTHLKWVALGEGLHGSLISV